MTIMMIPKGFRSKSLTRLDHVRLESVCTYKCVHAQVYLEKKEERKKLKKNTYVVVIKLYVYLYPAYIQFHLVKCSFLVRFLSNISLIKTRLDGFCASVSLVSCSRHIQHTCSCFKHIFYTQKNMSRRRSQGSQYDFFCTTINKKKMRAKKVRRSCRHMAKESNTKMAFLPLLLHSSVSVRRGKLYLFSKVSTFNSRYIFFLRFTSFLSCWNILVSKKKLCFT